MQYIWSPTLGDFDDSPEKVWGVTPYKSKIKPTVFCGVYSLKDLQKVKEHKGKRYIWWCGTDITRLIKGYWLDETGKNRVNPRLTARWIAKNCESWVENEVEAEALENIGIPVKICPSFMGNVDNFKPSYRFNKKPKLYTSVSGDDFKLYGWDKIEKLAKQNPNVEFYLYGNRKKWKTKQKNVIIKGRVSNAQFNTEIKNMQGCLRLTEFDGFSELVAKALLMAQYPVSIIPYPYTLDTQDIYLLKSLKEPNREGRTYYKRVLNNYPWVNKKNENY